MKLALRAEMIAGACLAIAGAIICSGLMVAEAIHPGVLDPKMLEAGKTVLPWAGMALGGMGILLFIISFIVVAKSETEKKS